MGDYIWDDMVEILKKEYKDTVTEAEKLAKQLDGFISKDRVIDALLCRHCTEETNCKDYCAYAKWILDLPAADVAPVRHGRWNLRKDGSGVCSECGFTQKDVWDVDGWQNFCGHCGADMRNGDGE